MMDVTGHPGQHNMIAVVNDCGGGLQKNDWRLWNITAHFPGMSGIIPAKTENLTYIQ